MIIAARMLARESAGKSVFYFIFIASRNGAGAKRINRLLAKTRTVELVDAGKKGRVSIRIERAIFMTAQRVLPMSAGMKVPSEIDQQYFESLVLREIGRQKQRWAGNAGKAGIVSDRKAEMVGIAEAVAKIPGETTI